MALGTNNIKLGRNKACSNVMYSNKLNKQNKTKQLAGFTIVELLVVIVVIGILAAITIVSYTGISKKANEAVVMSDLASNKKKMALYFAQYGSYPTSLDGNNCALLPNPDTNYCLKFSSGISLGAYIGTASSFSLSANGNGVAFSITDSSAPIVAENGWKQLSSGVHQTCGISTNNVAYCWGGNFQGQLGNNSTTQSLVPVPVDLNGVLNGKTIKFIATGDSHTCAIASDDLVYCWGYGEYGQLGNNSVSSSSVPVAVNTSGVLSGKTVKFLAVGDYHNCVIASDNQAYCWGWNTQGGLGNNSTVQSQVPVAVDISGVLSGKTIKTISAGDAHTCVIASNDLVYCWGYNTYGQLGNNAVSRSQVPVAVNTSGALSGKTVKSLTVAMHHTCAVASNDQAYCWGYNNNGQLGNNSITQSQIPVAVDISGVLNGKTIKSIAAGRFHSCATDLAGQSFCWGNNGNGQIGNNSTTQNIVPVPVDTGGVLNDKVIKSIVPGGNHTCAIENGGVAYCWGNGSEGQLGRNSILDSLVPVATQLP